MFSNYDLKENNFQIQAIFDIGTDQIPLSQNSRTCLESFATQRFDLRVLGCCREIITGLRGERPWLWWLSNHCVTGVLTFSLRGLRVPTVKSTSQMSYLKVPSYSQHSLTPAGEYQCRCQNLGFHEVKCSVICCTKNITRYKCCAKIKKY